MSLDGYTVTCQRGHDRATFTGQAALDHVQSCHGRKPGTIYRPTSMLNWNESVRQGPRIWKPCDQVVKARPWVAPKAPREVPAAFLEKLEGYGTERRDGTWWLTGRDVDGPVVTHEYVTESSECAA